MHRLTASGWWKPSLAGYSLRPTLWTSHGHELPSDDAALRGAANWLTRAHDATADGGIAGRYRLSAGWSSSYPETTGYAVPTLIALADLLADPRYLERARRCVEFLLSVQLPSGAFPALEIADNRTAPSPFNSAQILHGLHQWHLATGDESVLDPIRRAGRWICDMQDEDGAWRKYFYREIACAYSAHAACWLAEAAEVVDEPRFLAAAARNLKWVLSLRDADTGWFDRAGFSEADHERRRAHTHTIAYTLDGVRRLSDRLDLAEGRDAVHLAATRLAERMERARTLAGVLNHRWRPEAEYVCLTGNAQMALIWLQVARACADLRLVNAAFKAIDEVKRAQALTHPDAGIRGGIPGTWPIGGTYIQYAFPNWAAKFFIDALCAKRAWLSDCRARLENRDAMRTAPIYSTERSVSPIDGIKPDHTPSVAVYTTRISPKFAALSERWRARAFSPSLVVIETWRASVARQLITRLRRRGDDSARICRHLGWRSVRVDSINSEAALRAIRRIEPLVAVAAGAGILREAALALPRLGTLNAHMGLLPGHRGMNVAEWAALRGETVGCTVFWLDEGIDTGDVVATAVVDIGDCRSIDDLRARVDERQLDLLDETIRSIVERGSVPVAIAQSYGGRQYYAMHADLKRMLNLRLGAAQIPRSKPL
jgi:hypothetical protein